MITDYGALADYLIALADQMGDGYTTDDDVVTIERLRAAAAALRALVADNERLRVESRKAREFFDNLHDVEKPEWNDDGTPAVDWEASCENMEAVIARLRRKVARYVGKARHWLEGERHYEGVATALLAERDAALDALECMCDERAGIPSVVAAARALLARHGRET